MSAAAASYTPLLDAAATTPSAAADSNGPAAAAAAPSPVAGAAAAGSGDAALSGFAPPRELAEGEEAGVDPSTMPRTGCDTVCDFLFLLRLRDGVPYDNVQHALRAEHDWSIVTDSCCCCLRPDRRNPKGHKCCGCSGPRGARLWAPAARWNVFIFATLLTFFMVMFFAPSDANSAYCDHARQCLSACDTDFPTPAPGASDTTCYTRANPTVDTRDSEWYLYPNTSSHGFAACHAWVADSTPPQSGTDLLTTACVWACLPPGVSGITGLSSHDDRPACSSSALSPGGSGSIDLLCHNVNGDIACSGSSLTADIAEWVVNFLFASLTPIIVRKLYGLDCCGSNAARRCCSVSLTTLLVIANIVWAAVCAVGLTQIAATARVVFGLFFIGQASTCAYRIAVICAQWAYTQRRWQLKFWSNYQKPWDATTDDDYNLQQSLAVARGVYAPHHTPSSSSGSVMAPNTPSYGSTPSGSGQFAPPPHGYAQHQQPHYAPPPMMPHGGGQYAPGQYVPPPHGQYAPPGQYPPPSGHPGQYQPPGQVYVQSNGAPGQVQLPFPLPAGAQVIVYRQ